MDYKIVWSLDAIEDIESIAEYIGRSSKLYASTVVSKIVHTAESIGKLCNAGHVVSELGNNSIRERFVYSYRLIYRIEEKHIVILAVLHGKRLLESVGERFE